MELLANLLSILKELQANGRELAYTADEITNPIAFGRKWGSFTKARNLGAVRIKCR